MHCLCNGTRLIFNSVISNKVLSCTIVESQAVVLIPRITFASLSDDSWPIDWQRKQFPVKPAFAITINKSQSQTMQIAGLFLRPEVSRVRSPAKLKVAAMNDYVKNIVFRDVLI